jgi:hypothetical protein
MKFKYLETIQQGSPVIEVIEGQTNVKVYVNVKFEIVETGTEIADEFKFIECSIPQLNLVTDSIQSALTEISAAGLQWLKDTFGEANVIS